ncbi:MAG: peptidase M10, partial [Pseudomonadota bacterium]
MAKLLGAVFGPTTVANPQYVGVGLTVADEGLSYEKLAEFAVDARNLTSSDEIVTTLWNNLFGTMPSDSEKASYVKQLDTGELSIGALTIL